MLTVTAIDFYYCKVYSNNVPEEVVKSFSKTKPCLKAKHITCSQWLNWVQWNMTENKFLFHIWGTNYWLLTSFSWLSWPAVGSTPVITAPVISSWWFSRYAPIIVSPSVTSSWLSRTAPIIIRTPLIISPSRRYSFCLLNRGAFRFYGGLKIKESWNLTIIMCGVHTLLVTYNSLFAVPKDLAKMSAW